MSHSVPLIWSSFAFCIAVIVLAGPELSRSGDVIASKTGLSGNWIGLALLASITSLPELITGVSAVTVAQAPDIAVGDVFGSCVFNLAILVVVDFLSRGESVYSRARQGHVLSAGFGVVLIGFAGISLLMRGNGIIVAIGSVGLYTPVILMLYAVAMRSLFHYERAHREEFAETLTDRFPNITLRAALVRYSIAAAVVVALGTWLPFIGAALSDAMGWRQSFVGTIFVATVTSLPELVVTLAALRIGAIDMAVANLLGSNLFDMVVLAVDDLFFVRGPLLSSVSTAHAASALSAVIMTGIAIIGLFLRPRKRVFRRVAWASLGLFVIYFLNSYALFLERG